TIAQAAEKLGFYAVMGNDHIITPKSVQQSFPDPPNFYELLMTSAFLAPVTGRLKLIMGVIVVPLRDPVILAKQVATLDVLSGGRVILGVGIGSHREEFEALYPRRRRANRGEILEESIQALKVLFGERRASFEGKYVQFRDVEISPKPQQRSMPLIVSGNAPDAIRRAARLGNGWLASGMPPEEIREAAAILRETAAAHGRDFSTFDVALQFSIAIGRSREEAEAKFRRWQSALLRNQPVESFARRNLFGTPDEIKSRIEEYANAGVTHLAGIRFAAQTVSELLEGMTLFAETVMPAF
ncbi:MAG: TIGR03619 family F420-dependent LLM class oxidoreductase, partial [Candidatus Tectomicrobia bacterium]|nr:TIGR03619 family F420-dependent LLM class oxidoreductase [Candidatus Tectomicrobia bacterium]